MSDSNRIKLSYIKENSFGEVVSGSPLKVIRYTGENFKQDQQLIQSGEIRSDRQVVDHKRSSFSVSGDLNFEFSARTFDDFLLAALQTSPDYAATFGNPNLTISAQGVTINPATNSFTLEEAFGDLRVGQWLKISGCTNPENNGYAKVLVVYSNKIVVNKDLTDGDGGDVTMVIGNQATNGVNQISFNIERCYEDLEKFSIFTGMMINELNLTVAADSIITGSLGFQGRSEVSADSSIGSGYTAAPKDSVMNAVDNVYTILADGVELPTSQLTLQVSNNLRLKNKIGSAAPFDIGSGDFVVSGTFSAYYKDAAIYDKFLNDTETSIAFVVTDNDGHSYIIDIPAVKFSSGDRSSGGKNSDVMAEMGFSAKMSALEGTTMQISKFARRG